MKSMDSDNGIKTEDGINGVKGVNGVNVKRSLDGLNGVAHTQNQASDISKALVEGVISLEKLQTAKDRCYKAAI